MYCFDDESELMATLATNIKDNYPESTMWEGSPFQWITRLSSKRIGAVGELLVQNWCQEKGYKVRRPIGSSSYDRVINGHRVEIKYSKLWDNRTYRFQQLRNQDFDFYFWIGVSPRNVQAWFIPKEYLKLGVGPQPEGVIPQHGGKSGQDTWWIKVDADSPPEWMEHFGGSLSDVNQILKSHPAGSILGE